MRPIGSFDTSVTLRGLLFDLDDTVLDHGTLSADTYAELWRLHQRGVPLVGVTGRPSGWGQVLARQWPVVGIVTENGALAMTRKDHAVLIVDRCSSAERKSRRARLEAIAERLEADFGQLVRSDDCSARVSDITFDIGETRHVPKHEVDAVVTAAHTLGARTTRSSVHLHITLDKDDKASGALRFLHTRLAVAPSAALHSWAFIGDSENDAPCFAAFRNTVGVANLRGHFSVPPRYKTTQERGAGFVEATQKLFP